MNEYQYILEYKGEVKILEESPAGWDEIGVTYLRNKTYSSVLRSMALSIRFPRNKKGGGLFIIAAYDVDGITANINITINERSKKTNGWVLFYKGTLDLTPGNFIKERDFVECGIQDSQKLQKFVSRDELELDVFSTVSVDGEAMEAFTTDPEIILTPVDIILSAAGSATMAGVLNMGPDNFNVEINGTDIAIEHNELGDRFTLDGGIIYVNSTTENINISAGVFGNYAINVHFSGVDVGGMEILFVKYEFSLYDESGIVIEDVNIYVQFFTYSRHNIWDPSTKNWDVSGSFEHKFTHLILPGYYITLKTIYDLSGVGESNCDVTQTGGATVSIIENSGNVLETSARSIFPHEAFTRLIQLTTNEHNTAKILRSEFFGKEDSQFQTYETAGIGSKDGIANGLLIRKYPNQPLNLSLRKLFKSFDAVYCLGLGYDQINERFFIEKKQSFYKPNVLIFDLGEVSEFKSYPSTDYFSSILAGYKNDGNYENIQGANEINVNRSYSINPPVKEELNAQSEYNFDSVGPEIARRKPYTSFANTDTRFDQNTYIFRTDGVRPVLNPSITGFAGIEKYYNTMLSPRENLIRWAGWLKSILWKTTQGVKYVKSVKNVAYNYTNQNGSQVNELDDIAKSELVEDPMFIPEIYEFKSYINTSMISKLNADPHGFIRCNFDGVTYEGFIDQITTGEYNKTATFKLIGKILMSGENWVYENDTENVVYENETENVIYG